MFLLAQLLPESSQFFSVAFSKLETVNDALKSQFSATKNFPLDVSLTSAEAKCTDLLNVQLSNVIVPITGSASFIMVLKVQLIKVAVSLIQCSPSPSNTQFTKVALSE